MASPDRSLLWDRLKCEVSVLFCRAAFFALVTGISGNYLQHLVGKRQHLSNGAHPVAVLGRMSCQDKANVQTSLDCSWSRSTNGPAMETVLCACCTAICYRLMICHRFIAFKGLFMNPLHERAYDVKGAAEHLWSCSPFVAYVSVTEKKPACLWPLITYGTCEALL